MKLIKTEGKKKPVRKTDTFKSCQRKSSAGVFISTSWAFLRGTVWGSLWEPLGESWKFPSGNSLGKSRTYRCTSLWRLPTGGTGGARRTARSLNGWLHGVCRLSRGWASSKSMFADNFSINAAWEPYARGREPTYWHACVGELEVETTSRANKPRKLLLERAWRLLDHRLLLMPCTVGPLHFSGGFRLGF